MRQYVTEDISMAKMGRPKGPKEERRTERITVPLNEAELQQISDAAEGSGLAPATFCRVLLLKETENKSKK
jgi:hypothetical protein